MIKSIILSKGTNKNLVEHITCRTTEGYLLAIIYRNKIFEFSESKMPLDKLNDIQTIAENFDLFYNNI